MSGKLTKDELFKKTVVITGASAGIGRATALLFAKAGVQLTLISRNMDRLKKVKEEVEMLGCECLIVSADVANYPSIDEAAAKTEKLFGPIDIWINNAMVSVFSPIREMQVEEFHRVTDVTYLGVVHGTMAALKRMLPRNRGVIVQVGSALAYRGIPLQAAYCAAKHAAEGFHESLLSELAHDKSNVKVSMVQLPAHNTPQFDWVKSTLPYKAKPVPPIFQPEVAARAIFHAAYNPRREYIVAWPAIKAVWANKFIPGILDRYLGRIGYMSQQTQERKDPNQASNLYQTVNGNFGAHGRFDNEAIDKKVWVATDQTLLGLSVAVLLILALIIAAIILSIWK